MSAVDPPAAPVAGPAYGQWAALFRFTPPHGPVPGLAADAMARTGSFVEIVMDLQHEAATQRLKAMLEVGERLSPLLAELAAARTPKTALAAHIDISAVVFKAGLDGVTAWADTAQELLKACNRLGADAGAALFTPSPSAR